MSNSERQWLDSVPWESVLILNKTLCQAQKLEQMPNAKGYEPAQRLWQASSPKRMTLRAVLQVFHDACALTPFMFNNGNTFAAISRTLLDEHFKSVPPVEAQILRTTVCHYVVGQIGSKELQQVLRHFEPMLTTSQSTAKSSEPRASQVAAVQEQRA